MSNVVAISRQFGSGGSRVGRAVAQRARFARTLTGHDWYDATLYDLCLNTATTGLDRAVDLVVDLVQRPTTATLSKTVPRTIEDGNAR